MSACGQRILNLFEHIFESCAQTLGSHPYLGGHTRSEEAAPRRIFSSLALWTRQLFEGDGSPLKPQDCTLMKVSRRSHPLCPRQLKNVTSGLWQQVWPMPRCPFGKSELASYCSVGREKSEHVELDVKHSQSAQPHTQLIGSLRHISHKNQSPLILHHCIRVLKPRHMSFATQFLQRDRCHQLLQLLGDVVPFPPVVRLTFVYASIAWSRASQCILCA